MEYLLTLSMHEYESVCVRACVWCMCVHVCVYKRAHVGFFLQCLHDFM